jgi:RsiW-degrading membrane proteinase PrsW (M82 family)
MATQEARWYDVLPRWAWVGLIMLALSGADLLIAQLTHDWVLAPSAIIIGSMAAPLAFVVWIDDRTHVGRSVPPDVLFVIFLVGGGAATIIAGVFEADFFYNPSGPGYLWIGFVEETAKLVVPVAVCTLVPRYRPVPQALALGIVSAAGFAVFESVAYSFNALDQSVGSARHVLYERSLATPFGHITWTTIAIVVAASAWDAKGRVLFTPRALWGYVLAVVLHTIWDIGMVNRGLWLALIPLIAVTTFAILVILLKGIVYEGPYAVPREHPLRGRHR